MAKVKSWKSMKAAIEIVLEAGKDDANKERFPHVHVYKRGRRTRTRIPGVNRDLDAKDYEMAVLLFTKYQEEIKKLYEGVKRGEYDL